MGAWSWGGVIRGCNAFLENYMRSPASANDKDIMRERSISSKLGITSINETFWRSAWYDKVLDKTIRTFTRKGIHASHNRLHTDVPGQGNRVPAQADRCV